MPISVALFERAVSVSVLTGGLTAVDGSGVPVAAGGVLGGGAEAELAVGALPAGGAELVTDNTGATGAEEGLEGRSAAPGEEGRGGAALDGRGGVLLGREPAAGGLTLGAAAGVMLARTDAEPSGAWLGDACGVLLGAALGAALAEPGGGAFDSAFSAALSEGREAVAGDDLAPSGGPLLAAGADEVRTG